MRRNAPTILFLVGNVGNMGLRMDSIEQLYNLGYNVLAISYRGYSTSQGKPSEQGLKLDAQAAFDYLLNCDSIHQDKIFVFGMCLGGSIAIDLCSKNPNLKAIKGLVIENTFTKMSEAIVILFPWMKFIK